MRVFAIIIPLCMRAIVPDLLAARFVVRQVKMYYIVTKLVQVAQGVQARDNKGQVFRWSPSVPSQRATSSVAMCGVAFAVVCFRGGGKGFKGIGPMHGHVGVGGGEAGRARLERGGAAMGAGWSPSVFGHSVVLERLLFFAQGPSPWHSRHVALASW